MSMPYVILAAAYVIFCGVAAWVDVWAGVIFAGMGITLVCLVSYLIHIHKS